MSFRAFRSHRLVTDVVGSSNVTNCSSAPHSGGLWKRRVEIHTHYTLLCSSDGHIQVKVKVKFTIEQATKAQRGSRGITLLFL